MATENGTTSRIQGVVATLTALEKLVERFDSDTVLRAVRVWQAEQVSYEDDLTGFEKR